MSTGPHNESDASISTYYHETLEQNSAAKSSEPAAAKIEYPEGGVVGEEEEGEEEEGECGFCLFMKGGGCKDTFEAWEECIAAAENGMEDIAEKCFKATSLLRKCMEVNADYYEPVLRAEKHAEDVATIEVEKLEKAGGLDSGKPDAA